MVEDITKTTIQVKENNLKKIPTNVSPPRGLFLMLEGRCPKCGIRYYGWALFNPKYQTCPDCGTELVLKDSNGIISEGYSPPLIDKNHLKEIMNIVDDKKKRKHRRTGDQE